MLLNLILGAIAGFLTPIAEPHLKKIIAQMVPGKLPVGHSEFDMLTLIILLMAATVLIALLGGDSAAFVLLLGALLGLFGKQVYKGVTGSTDDEDKAP
jgi:hypothetical protein